MSDQIPFVDYLVLGDPPHLVANECTSCGARFFDRRNACASCSGSEFKSAAISTQGELRHLPDRQRRRWCRVVLALALSDDEPFNCGYPNKARSKR